MTTTAPLPTDADRAHLRAALVAVLDMGVDVCRVVHRQVIAEEIAEKPTPQLVKLGATYDRVSRAVRLTVLLIERLDAEAAKPAPTHPDALAKSVAIRKRIIREVEDAIAHAVAEHPEADTIGDDLRADLRAELKQRLDRPDFEDELANEPTETVIRHIIHDLGLRVPGESKYAVQHCQRRTPADLARLLRDATPPRPTPS